MHRVGRAKASLTPTVARLERLDALLPTMAAEPARRRFERDRDTLRWRLGRKLWGVVRSGALAEPRRRRAGGPTAAQRHELRWLVDRAARLLPGPDAPADLSGPGPGTVRQRKLAARLGVPFPLAA